MAKKQTKITISAADWRIVHPADVKCKSDLYYAKLASRLANLVRGAINGSLDLVSEDYERIGIDLAAYLEDKVTGMNIWNAFISLYGKQMGDSFPFYDTECEEMFDDEPNYSDIKFLLWRGLDAPDQGSFINPLNRGIEILAADILAILEEEYETAPESPEFYKAIYEAPDMEDTLQIRGLCQWALMNSYVFCAPYVEDNLEEVYGEYNVFLKTAPEVAKIYFVSNYVVMNTTSGPLNLYPWEWLSEMMKLSGKEEESQKFQEIKTYTMLPNLIREIKEDGIIIENVNDDELFVSYDTISDEIKEDMEVGGVIYASLFFYNGAWHVNGISSFIQAKEAFDTTKAKLAEKKRNMKAANDYQLEKNGGERIGAVANLDEFNNKFGLNNVKDVTLPEYKQIQENLRNTKNILYFLNTESSMSMIPDAAQNVKFPGNPYYDKKEATKQAASLILGEDTTDEMREYLIDNKMIPDARLYSSVIKDKEAKAWFARYARFIDVYKHSDTTLYNLP